MGCVGAKMNMVWAHMSSDWVMKTTEVAAVCALKNALWIVRGRKLGLVWAHKSASWVMNTIEVAAVCALKNTLWAVWGRK